MDECARELQHLPIGSDEISSPKGTLCDRCLAIPWKADNAANHQNATGFEGWTLDHHETFSDLEASCEAGCPLCQTFFLLLAYEGLGSRKIDPLRWYLGCYCARWYLYLDSEKFDHTNPWWMYDSGTPISSQTITRVKGIVTNTQLSTDANRFPQTSQHQV